MIWCFSMSKWVSQLTEAVRAIKQIGRKTQVLPGQLDHKLERSTFLRIRHRLKFFAERLFNERRRK
jgi:hypothetical protein